MNLFNFGKAKGIYGSINNRKKTHIIISVCLLALIGILILIGYLVFGNFTNIIMLPALLIAIPFANFVATLFAIIKFKSAEPEKYAMMRHFDEAGMLLSDMVIVDSDGKRYYCEFIVIYKNGIVAYTTSKFRPQTLEIYVNDMMKHHGVGLNIKVYTDWDAFLSRIDGAEAPDEESKRKCELAQETLLLSSM